MTSRDNGIKAEGINTFAEMRKDFRAAISSTAAISLGESAGEADAWIKAEVLDLSLGGARVSFELDDESRRNLPGTACTVRFSIKGEIREFPGRFAGVYSDTEEEITEIQNNCPEMGIAFEGLSVDDKSDLVSLFMWTKLEQSQGSHQNKGDF